MWIFQAPSRKMPGTPGKSTQLLPRLALFYIDGERDAQLNHILHEVAEGVSNIELIFRNFENQLVMTLQPQAGAKPPPPQFIGNPDHGDFNDVGCGSLNRRIDRSSLRHAAAHTVS